MSCIQTTSQTPRTRARAHAAFDAARSAAAAFGRRLALWFTRYQTRRVLRELDAHLLRDIGLTREQAAREAAKPFWID